MPRSPAESLTLPPETWFVLQRRSPIIRYAESSPREVRKQSPDSAASLAVATSSGCVARVEQAWSHSAGLHPHVRFTKDGGGGSSSQPPAVPARSARRCGTARADLRAAVASTVTLRSFRS